MNSRSRGQSSLEFMMTYGWVLLIVLVVFVLMWQWGLFSVSARVDPGSFGLWGVVVNGGNDFILNDNGVLSVALFNNVGANVTVISANVSMGPYMSSCDARVEDCIYTDGTFTTTDNVIPSGEVRLLKLSNTLWVEKTGRRFEAFITIRYNDTRTVGEGYQSAGRFWGNVEPAY